MKSYLFIWTKVPVDTAKKRQQAREVLPDQPTVPAERFNQLVANLQPPEGHELCIEIDGTRPFAEQFASFQAQLGQIEAKNG